MARFSKTTMISNLELKAQALKTEWGFDPNNGTAQLQGKPEEVWVAYGEYRMCLALVEEIDEGRV